MGIDEVNDLTDVERACGMLTMRSNAVGIESMMSRKRPIYLGLAAFLACAVAGDFVGLGQSANETPASANPSPVLVLGPDVVCGENDCSVRAAVMINGRRLVSSSLPFSAVSAHIVPIPVDSGFGIGESDGRAITAWSIGTEEKSVAVAMEPIAIGSGHGVIVHQVAGFEHPKRAHVVLEIREDELKTHLELVEGPGPDYTALWPESEGVALSRSFGDSATTRQIEHYRWKGSGPTRSLVPMQ